MGADMTSINSIASGIGQVPGVQLESHLDVERGIGMMGSDASLRKILVNVETSLARNIPEIWTALEVGDVAAANRLLHAIKGYAPIFCTDALVAQVVQVEQLSKTEPVIVVKSAFADLAPKFESLLNEIRTYVAQG